MMGPDEEHEYETEDDDIDQSVGGGVTWVGPLYGGPQKTDEERFATMPAHFSVSGMLGDGNRRRRAG